MTGSAGQKRVPRAFLESYRIPLPPLAEQKRIAAILDKADAIRRKLQQSLRLSDEFLRSVFLDMFGDPKTNSKGWPEEPMSELMSDSKIGLVRASDQFGWDMPVPYVRMDALTNDGAFLPEKVQGTNATPAEIASYSLKPGDFLFNTRNSKELVGKVAIYPGPEGATFNNNLMRIRFRKGIDPYVICAQFQFPRVQRELEARKQGTTSVFAVYGKNLATLQFLVPPSDLQRDYRKVVDKVSAARQKMKSLLAQSESAFSSLQQRAFRGEL
ncbi:MAG: restriction endonuclease subunit S [Verrucomicrobia bacterium]|nr:restriction endonuclease subunit S [Verrucomicrobiota bacterium]